MPVSRFVERLKSDEELGANVVYHRRIRPRLAEYSSLPPLNRRLADRLSQMGLKKLYTHQATAITAGLRGENVIVTTPTASGKSLCYMAPVVNELMENPGSTAIFMFPLKALGHDQFNTFREFTAGLPGDLRAETFDGDTPKYARKKIVNYPPRVIFTNPDMLHLSILPYYGKWKNFLKRLRFVVIDEAHTYRGVFGSHMAQVIRRLNRIAAHYGAEFSFIASSATISNPAQFAQALTGAPFTVVDRAGSPRPGGHFVVYNTQASPYTDASRIFRGAVKRNLKTIAFTKARKITELIYSWTIEADPELAERIGCYRAGFLPEERRAIERDLFNGKLDGVVSTSALEMGVNIGGLDFCLLVGYPGTIMNTWQRGGRVGRGANEFLIMLVAQQDALDQYFVHHPGELFSRGFEAAVVDPDNEPIVKAHLVCACAELPISRSDKWFQPTGRHKKLFEELLSEGRLVLSKDGSKWLSPGQYPHRGVSIRSVGENYAIFRDDGKTLIGNISGSRVFSECHEGAVYLHHGKQYHVSRLDHEKKIIHTKPMSEKYYTRPKVEKETQILETLADKEVNGFTIKLGKLKVTEQVTGYEKRSIFGQKTLGVYELDSPKTQFETVGFWIEIHDNVKDDIEKRGLGYMGGIHAFEHVCISLFPLLALCDRNDIGGISYPVYPALGVSAIFFYDGYPGGVGLSQAVYENADQLWKAALGRIADCQCEAGCPSCVHSPKCGSGNKPLDKAAGKLLLEYASGACPAPKRPATPARRHAVQSTAGNHLNKTERKGKMTPNTADINYKQRILFFDLETQRSAEDVGGWNNADKMGLAVAVIYDTVEKQYLRYWEEDVDRLVGKILSADLVIGFNHLRFDYKVLAGYTKADLRSTARSFDILDEVRQRLGFRLGLGSLAQTTLGKPKTADGLVSLQWWNEGRKDEVADYCQVDVEITKELFEFGLKNGYLLYTLKNGEPARIIMDWNIDDILASSALPHAGAGKTQL